MAIEVFAPAKVNLALHVTGQRADGYHLLDSIVVFANIGDRVAVNASDRLQLKVTGPEAGNLAGDDDNLVLRAARFFAPDCTAMITLTKNLPIASGIGGGSADAAATLKALSQFTGAALPAPEDTIALGADVPACLMGRPLRLRGIGDRLADIPSIPDLDILLVTPRVTVSTPAIFVALTSRSNPPLADDLPQWPDQAAFCRWLAGTRNDLTAPAIKRHPEIADALALIRETDCLFAGMSGSGATCFGLYLPDGHTANAARAHFCVERPNWWCRNGKLS